MQQEALRNGMPVLLTRFAGLSCRLQNKKRSRHANPATRTGIPFQEPQKPASAAMEQPVYVFAGCHEACKKTAGFTPPTKPSRAPSYTHTRLLILAFFRLCKSSGPCSKEQTAPETILIGQFLPKNKAVSHKILHEAKNAKFSVSHKPLTSKVEKMLGSAKVKSACVRMGQLLWMEKGGCTMRLIVAGSRTFKDYSLLSRKLDALLSRWVGQGKEIIIISGGAKGADALGQAYARKRGFNCTVVPAEWNKYGRSAGYRRNEVMAAMADAVVAFWDGSSPGTSHMIRLARERRLPLRIISV